MAQIIDSLAEISERYDAIFCDVWGVIHDGVVAHIDACNALGCEIRKGRPVILLTNSPRPAEHVERQIREIGVPDESWTRIVTSGDSARYALFRGEVGTRVYHIGPDSALSFFGKDPGPDGQSLEISRVSFEQAEGIVCTGLFDDLNETPDDYRAVLAEAVRREMKLLCANPDFIVDRGSRRVYCAGALAALYTALGGTTLMFGKPLSRIYDLARMQLHSLLPDTIAPRILCIGDGIETDIGGARNQSLDSLFVTGGLSLTETGTRIKPDPVLLAKFLSDVGASPDYAIGFLR